MKITAIDINDFHQFKDFHLNLTYPKGHEKEGQPLEKVCIIGQSGAGKTTILKIINELISELRDSIDIKNENGLSNDFSIEVIVDNLTGVLGKFSKKKEFQSNYFEKGNLNWYLYHNTNNKVLLYFPSELLEKSNFSADKGIDDPFKYIKTETEQNGTIQQEKENLSKKRIFDFEKDDPVEIWKSILLDASDYMVKELSYSQRIAKALVKNTEEANKILKEFKNWQNENPSPFKELAKVLNPVIERFYIRIKSDFDFERAEDLQFIKMETINGKEVLYNIWSTGTKQVVLTAIPIYKLNTENAIILIDEPERSLYPDVQKEIIDYYTSLAPNAQFFFATHSPVIASSFEPWEIVELKFDYDKGLVFQEKYYDGERHVDNYFINPQYLRWDSILTKIFDIKERGNEKRIEKLMELSSIGKQIEKEKNPEKKTEIYKEYKKLAELLDWEVK